MNSINFLGKETVLNTAKKVVNNTTHEYKSNSMLGIVKDTAEKATEKKDEVIEAVKAKYAPFTVKNDKTKELEELTDAYNRARGNV